MNSCEIKATIYLVLWLVTLWAYIHSLKQNRELRDRLMSEIWKAYSEKRKGDDEKK